MVYQVFVRILDGRSLCLQVASNSITADELLEASVPFPPTDVVLYTGTRVLSPSSRLVVGPDGFFPSCHVSLRLLGGKGGFGSLLRGAAAQAGAKKTTNFDACRDMSGRRLRHVNAEKKLKEWKHESKERDLEKVAQNYIKKLAKEQRKKEREVVVGKEVKEQSEQVLDRVAEAVKLGMVSSRKISEGERKRKRAAVAQGEKEREKGRARSLLGLELGSVEEDEEEEEEEESEEDSEEEEEGDDEEESEESEKGKEDTEAKTASQKPRALVSGLESGPGQPLTQQSLPGKKDTPLPQFLDTFEGKPTSSPSSSGGKSGLATPEGADKQTLETNGGEAASAAQSSGECATDATSAAFLSSSGIIWDKVASSTELEVLGLEGLKSRLQEKGLKCGGTLQERAARLFLLKDNSASKIDKKHLAKPAGKK